MRNLRLFLYILTLLILSNICNALEDSGIKYKKEKVDFLGKSISLILPYTRDCTSGKCFDIPNFGIEIHEGNDKKSGHIILTNMKSSGFYRIDLSLNQDNQIISEGETETNRSFIDENTINICKRYTFRGEDLKILDYSIMHPLSNSGFCGYCDRTISNCDRFNIFNVKLKSFLHSTLKQPTKMYLIKGDKVTILDEETDNSGQKWYFINYKGKKELNMWIKAEAVDLAPKATEPKPTEKTTPKEPAPQTNITTPEPAEIAKQELDTNPPKNTEIIKAEKIEPIKSANGSSSFALLASMFGLLSLRLKNIM